MFSDRGPYCRPAAINRITAAATGSTKSERWLGYFLRGFPCCVDSICRAKDVAVGWARPGDTAGQRALDGHGEKEGLKVSTHDCPHLVDGEGDNFCVWTSR